MKKTIIALMALSSIAMAADVTAHGITFTTTDLSKGIQTWTDRAANNYYITGGVSWGNGNGGYDFGGLYVDDQGGMKFNALNYDFNVKYLYLTSGVQIGASTGDTVGQINWSNNNGANFVMINGGWVDINANYGDKIDTSGMTTGSIYLNTAGALTLPEDGVLGNGVTVFATLDLYADAIVQATGIGIVTRTLMTGDFSNWTGALTLNSHNITQGLVEMSSDEFGSGYMNGFTSADVGKYYITKSDTGLSINYIVPEPATATLSLLALAGLAARRRRATR